VSKSEVKDDNPGKKDEVTEEQKSTTSEDKQSKQDKKQQSKKIVKPHFTRSKQIQDMVLSVPPKPKLPSRRKAAKSKRWNEAYRREIVKINEEDVMIGFSTDDLGNFIRPDNAIVMKLLVLMSQTTVITYYSTNYNRYICRYILHYSPQITKILLQTFCSQFGD
jgi:hypothetical protein